MRVRPLSPTRLVEWLADRIAGDRPDRRLRVAVDGAPAAGPDQLADELVDPLRLRSRAAVAVRAGDFLRPASIRLETGHTDPDAYYDHWWDRPGLRREVLTRAGPGGDGRILPSLWDAETDRATRASYLPLPPTGVVLVSGPMLLTGELPFELTVHLSLSPAALARRTDAAQRWTLPAFARYQAEVAPERVADVVVRCDDPRRPALVEAW